MIEDDRRTEPEGVDESAPRRSNRGFWIVAKYFGISERDTLKTWTVLESVLSVAGFVVAAVLSLFV